MSAQASPQTIGILHTSPATVEVFGRLLREALPGIRLFNLLDDSILPQLGENGGDVGAVEPRWAGYAAVLRDRGANLLLNACSSIGELCERVEPAVGRPIVRVDAEMAREAVKRGARIAVVATLPTTLRPTTDLIAATARRAGRAVELRSLIAEGAYAALMAGDAAGHDDRIAACLADAAASSDVVVLAQASMARVVPRLPEADRGKVLASPPFAVRDVVQRLRGT